MDNQLFRKKSLDHISSPEELHDYMRVTSPRLWMLLAAVAALLAGILVYAATATLENTLSLSVQVHYQENGDDHPEITGMLPISRMNQVAAGMEARIGDGKGHVSTMTVQEGSEKIRITIQMDEECPPPAEGNHDAVLVLETIEPIRFLLN